MFICKIAEKFQSLPEASELSEFRLVTCISSCNLKRTENEWIAVSGLHAFSDDILFFAACSCLRAISLRTHKLSEADPCEPKSGTARFCICNVALDAETDTLLLVLWGYHYWLMSLRRGQTNWIKVQRHPIEQLDEIAVCNLQILLGNFGEDRLFIFGVNSQHRLSSLCAVVLENRYNYFACACIDGETLVAFSHDNALVTLRRLVERRIMQIACIKLTYPQRLLFRGNELLVADFNERTKSHEIVSLLATSGRLMLRGSLLPSNASVKVWKWCLSGDRLVVWDNKSKDILVYKND